MDGVMLLAVIFNISAEILCGRVALLESREANSEHEVDVT